MRVLIIEDDAALGLFLQKGLKLEGHDVELATNGQMGLEKALALRPDLMVLDLGLPQKDGVEVLEELDGQLLGTSVLVLTGRNKVEDRVRCLDLGADDCMLKPFSFNELIARCRALLRRRQQFADPTIRCGAVEINRMDRRVTCSGQAVELTVKEFALLAYLMQARGRVCSRSELLREVWQMSPDAGTNVVDVYVNYLRKKLGAAQTADFGGADKLIDTVRGEGYSMAATLGRRPVPSEIPQMLQGAMRGAGLGTWGVGGMAHA